MARGKKECFEVRGSALKEKNIEIKGSRFNSPLYPEAALQIPS